MLEYKDYETQMKMKPKSKNSPIDCPLPGCSSKQLKDLRAHLFRTHKAIPFEERKAIISNLFSIKHKKDTTKKAPLQLLIEELEMEEELDGQEHQYVQKKTKKSRDTDQKNSGKSLDIEQKKSKKSLDSDQKKSKGGLPVTDSDVVVPMPHKKGTKRKSDKVTGNEKKRAKKQKNNNNNLFQEKLNLDHDLPKTVTTTSNIQTVKPDQKFDIVGSLLPSMVCPPTSSKETLDMKQNDTSISSVQSNQKIDSTEVITCKRRETINSDTTWIDQEKEKEFFELLSALDLPDIEEICGGEERDNALDEKHCSESFHNTPDNDIRKSTKVTPVPNSTPVSSVYENFEEDTNLDITPDTNKSLDNIENVSVTPIPHNVPFVKHPETPNKSKPETTPDKNDIEATSSPTMQPPLPLLLQQSLDDMRYYISQHWQEFPCNISGNSKLGGSGLDAPLLQNYLPELARLLERTFDASKFNSACQIWVKMIEALSILLDMQHLEGSPHLLSTLCETLFLHRQSVMRRVIAILGINGKSNWQKNKLSLGCPYLFGKEFLDFVLGGHIGAKALQKRARCDKTLLASVMKKAAECWKQVENDKIKDNCNRTHERQLTQKALQWICNGVPQEHIDEASEWVGGTFHIDVRGKTFVKVNQFAKSLARCLEVVGTMNSNTMAENDSELVAKCLKYICTACALCEQSCDKSIYFKVQ